MKRRYAFVTALCLLVGAFGSVATAAPIVVQVGDNDGFGFGAAAVPDGAPLSSISVIPEDRRSAAEAAATNGAQQTDFYTAVFDPLPTSVDFIFPFLGTLNSGTLTVDMGDFQASTFGQLTVSLNGIAQPNLFNFEDGAFATAVRSFGLSAAVIAAANLANQVVLSVSRGASNDAISFDFLRLDADVDAVVPPVPEPATLTLMGLGACAAAVVRRRRRA